MKRPAFRLVLWAVWLGSLIIGCKQYPYQSPLPGVIEVRLKTSSTNLPYNPLNLFPMELTSVRAVRSDDAKMEVYEDLRAIRRSPQVIDVFEKTAFDSAMVIGEAYIPPGRFIGLDIVIQPVGLVVLDGYRAIQVAASLDNSSFVRLRNTIDVQGSRKTTVVVTLNADSSLTKGAEVFRYRAVFYISSSQIE